MQTKHEVSALHEVGLAEELPITFVVGNPSDALEVPECLLELLFGIHAFFVVLLARMFLFRQDDFPCKFLQQALAVKCLGSQWRPGKFVERFLSADSRQIKSRRLVGTGIVSDIPVFIGY